MKRLKVTVIEENRFWRVGSRPSFDIYRSKLPDESHCINWERYATEESIATTDAGWEVPWSDFSIEGVRRFVSEVLLKGSP